MSATPKDWPQSITRAAILDLQPYSARGAASNALHLDANESPWAPPPLSGTGGFNRYPAQQPPQMRMRLASLYGVAAEQIMIGRGADEAIDILLRTFCEPRTDQIMICPPTFGYYRIAAQIQGAETIEVPLTSSNQLDNAAILKAAATASALKIIFLCSPNNPTGNLLSAKDILALAAALPDVLIVVDEAYIEFSGQDSLAAQIKTYKNIAVLRTLSKAYSLAGVRTGCIIAEPAVIAMMLKVLPPYPVPRPSEAAVMAALSPSAMAVHSARLREILTERARMAEQLAQSKYVQRIYPSEANFLLLEIRSDEALLAALSQSDVKIRDFRNKIPGAMRMSIGTRGENDAALAAFGITSGSVNLDRIGETHRTTKETDISVRVNLDDPSISDINTGIGFYDHMLEALSRHGGFGLVLHCRGDLEIDGHHTIEDCALALGTALKQALGNKAGIGRFGFLMAMDETQAQVAIDLSGRPAMVFDGKFPAPQVGEFAAEMCPHFFESLAQTMGAAIQISVKGANTHHMIEASFKGVGRALRPAFARAGSEIPSTKGVL